MTREEVYASLWHKLPASKHLIGRRGVRRVADNIVKRWEPLSMSMQKAREQKIVRDNLSEIVAKDTYGSIMLMLFIGLVSAAVQALLEWWLLSEEGRRMFSHWKQELRG